VTVRARDESLNFLERTFMVKIVDTIKPVVKLNASIDTIIKGQNFIDYGVTVSDYTATVVYVSGSVNVNSSGTYILTYVVIDEANNITTTKRYVTVYDTSPQIRFILESAVTTTKVGDDYTDGLCKVLINDLEFSCTVKDNTVNNQIPGIYTITYSYIHNETEYTYKRYVFVVDGDEPLILYIPFRKEEGEEL
jgi:hypothetical protein